VREWWNAPPLNFKTPRHHLFAALGLSNDARGMSRVGKGAVVYESQSPAAWTYDKTGGSRVRALVQSAADAVGLPWKESNALVLRRGPYVIAAGLDESVPNLPPAALHGKFIVLFDATLPVVTDVILEPSRRAFLLDLAATGDREGILAAACRVQDPRVTAEEIQFNARGIEGSAAVVCIAIHQPPQSVTVAGKPLAAGNWDFADGLLRIRFVNAAEGLEVQIIR
jgi:hypothetical protein